MGAWLQRNSARSDEGREILSQRWIAAESPRRVHRHVGHGCFTVRVAVVMPSVGLAWPKQT